MSSLVSWQGLLEIATILGIPSLLVGVIALRLTLRRVGIAYVRDNQVLIGVSNAEFGPELRVLFGDREITSLVKTDVCIWNRGNKELRRTDLASAEPLRIRWKSEKPLRFAVRQMSTPSNRVQVRKETDLVADSCETPAVFVVDFEYLEPNEGFIVEILGEDINPKFELKGKIIGAGSKRIVFGESVFIRSAENSIFDYYFEQTIPTIMTGLISFIGFISIYNEFFIREDAVRYIFVIFVGMITAFCSYGFWIYSRAVLVRRELLPPRRLFLGEAKER